MWQNRRLILLSAILSDLVLQDYINNFKKGDNLWKTMDLFLDLIG